MLSGASAIGAGVIALGHTRARGALSGLMCKRASSYERCAEVECGLM